jgi:hypothetical protein
MAESWFDFQMFLFSLTSTLALGPLSPVVKQRRGHENDYSPALGTEVKNDGAIPSPHTSS